MISAIRSCDQLELGGADAHPAVMPAAVPVVRETTAVAVGAAAIARDAMPARELIAARESRLAVDGLVSRVDGEGAYGGEMAVTRRALASVVSEVMGGEVGKLVVELREAAVKQAEVACDAKVATLEAAVGELLGALDAESHKLLLKWKGQVDHAKQENRALKEQQRMAHIAHVDLTNQVKAERRRAVEAEERASSLQAAAVPRIPGYMAPRGAAKGEAAARAAATAKEAAAAAVPPPQPPPPPMAVPYAMPHTMPPAPPMMAASPMVAAPAAGAHAAGVGWSGTVAPTGYWVHVPPRPTNW